MNKLDVNQVGGFPLTTRILDELQKIPAVFNAYGGLSGDKTIISGCEVVGSNVGPGVVFVNNETFEFRGGSIQTKVIIKEDTENLVFENNESKTVIRTRYVTFGTGINAMNWEDFKRPIQTKELVTLFASINDTLSTILTKLDTIDEGAKVQVQTDWNQNDATKKDYLKNRPDISNPFLHKDKYDFGDVFDEDLLTVSFSNVGTDDYIVIGGLVGHSSDYTQDANVYFQTREHTATSFKLVLTEQAGGRFQNLSLYYALIPL